MKISVIIPVYNGARYLAETLDSVFAQTLAPHEVIIVDDGSTDESPDILRRYGDRLRVFRQENQGVATARNAGLTHVTGDAIAFLDQDDLWPADRNRIMAEALAANTELGVVLGQVEMLNQATVKRPLPAKMITAPREMLVGSFLVRPSVFAKVGNFKTTVGYSDDTDFLMRRGEHKIATLYLDIVTLIYRLHDHNTSLDDETTRFHTISVFRKRSCGGDGARHEDQLHHSIL